MTKANSYPVRIPARYAKYFIEARHQAVDYGRPLGEIMALCLRYCIEHDPEGFGAYLADEGIEKISEF